MVLSTASSLSIGLRNERELHTLINMCQGYHAVFDADAKSWTNTIGQHLAAQRIVTHARGITCCSTHTSFFARHSARPSKPQSPQKQKLLVESGCSFVASKCSEAQHYRSSNLENRARLFAGLPRIHSNRPGTSQASDAMICRGVRASSSVNNRVVHSESAP